MKVNGKTKLIGVIGYPIEHSFSPKMHNAAIDALGLNWCYVPFNVHPKHLKEAINALKALNIVGINVTVPHKQASMKFLDEISKEASAVGAVNTIVNEKGKLKGYNTDLEGVIKALKYEVGLEKFPQKVLLIGAGGAARAITYALVNTGQVREILILNRTPQRALKLAQEMEKVAKDTQIKGMALKPENIFKGLKDAEMLINATPVGMYPETSLSPVEDISPFHSELIVFDLIYNPEKTKLIKLAQAAGAKAFNGLSMLVYQGASSFELWTGQKPPIEVMKRAIQKQLP